MPGPTLRLEVKATPPAATPLLKAAPLGIILTDREEVDTKSLVIMPTVKLPSHTARQNLTTLQPDSTNPTSIVTDHVPMSRNDTESTVDQEVGE